MEGGRNEGRRCTGSWRCHHRSATLLPLHPRHRRSPLCTARIERPHFVQLSGRGLSSVCGLRRSRSLTAPVPARVTESRPPLLLSALSPSQPSPALGDSSQFVPRGVVVESTAKPLPSAPPRSAVHLGRGCSAPSPLQVSTRSRCGPAERRSASARDGFDRCCPISSLPFPSVSLLRLHPPLCQAASPEWRQRSRSRGGERRGRSGRGVAGVIRRHPSLHRRRPPSFPGGSSRSAAGSRGSTLATAAATGSLLSAVRRLMWRRCVLASPLLCR